MSKRGSLFANEKPFMRENPRCSRVNRHTALALYIILLVLALSAAACAPALHTHNCADDDDCPFCILQRSQRELAPKLGPWHAFVCGVLSFSALSAMQPVPAASPLATPVTARVKLSN